MDPLISYLNYPIHEITEKCPCIFMVLHQRDDGSENNVPGKVLITNNSVSLLVVMLVSQVVHH